jgi:hypothetical protein
MKYYIIILIVVFIILFYNYNNTLVKTRANNNKIYYTQKNKSHIAANKLAKIDSFINKLTKHLLEENKNHVMIQKNLKKNLIINELPKHSKHVAYIVNKTKLHICLRNKNDKFINQYNRVYFVVMHELAHKITRSIGHTDEFWDNFKLIIKTAIKHKLYTYRDYYNNPVEYCGININSSPYIKGGNNNDNIIYIIILLLFLTLIFVLYFNSSNSINSINSINSSNSINNINSINSSNSSSDCITDPNYGPDSPDYATAHTDIWGQHVVRPLKLNFNNRISLEQLTLSDVRK